METTEENMENNLSETAFVVKEEQGYRLRWFTPGEEVDLCGHATLASSFVLRTFVARSISDKAVECLARKMMGSK